MTNPLGMTLHPEVVRLCGENELLYEEVVHLLTESHDLVHTVKPNLLALYLTKIGSWELKQFHLQCRAARLKRKAEMIQASLNQGKWPDLVVIEAQLDAEFSAWEHKLQMESERITEAEERLRHLLSPQENRELKTLYYRLAKKLHPDLNPGLTEEHKLLWRRAQAAYESGNLEELRALTILVDRAPLPASPASSLQRLEEERHRLEGQIRRLLEEIEQIEGRHPLTLRSKLADDAWVQTRLESIQAAIAEIEERCASLMTHIQTLLKEYPGEQLFGNN